MSRTLILRLFYILIIAGCAYGVAASRITETSPVLRVVANSSPQDEDYHGARAFRRVVESRMDGELRVEIFPYGQFCSSPRECIYFLETGVLDVFMTTGGGRGPTFGPGQIVEAPYRFPDDAVAECVLDGPFTERLRDAVMESGRGMRLMVIGNTGGWRNFATTGKPIRQAGDLRGAKIRTTVAEMQQVFMRSFGATPTPISWSELYVSMATGVVDGTTNSLADIVSANLHEHIRYVTLDEHTYMGAMWWFSEPRWRELAEGERAAVSAGFDELRRVTRQVALDNEARARTVFLEGGGEIITLLPDQRAAFRAASEPIRPWFSKLYGAEWFDMLDAAIAGCDAAEDA
ncbi:MAG: TRAP transporter substrate-binding protein DctP [Caulobacterales bacterium]|nr:TRAP transporter substrate-binding protein DctP [Caulobacterales bacterium]